MIWVQTTIEANFLKLKQYSEHIHVAIIQECFLKSSGGGQAPSYVAEVYSKQSAFATVVVDLIQNQRRSTCLCPRADAVEVSHVSAWEGISYVVVSQCA